MERWKELKGYEGLYQISDKGRVLSVARNTTKGGIRKAVPDKDGYLCVDLFKNNKRKNCKIHRLVALSFLEKEDGKNIVNHKDENKQNNCVENLEWCDVEYNNTYNHRQEKINARKRKPICGVATDGTKVFFPSVSEASKQLHISRRNIQFALSGKQKTAGEYRWYVEKEGAKQ